MISIIAAIGEHRELGYKGKIPWHIKADFQHFKKITQGHPVIMGRKTYESIGQPLAGRTNIVVSRSPKRNITPGVLRVVWTSSIEQALQKAKQAQGSEEIFVIGGAQVYNQALRYVDKLYLTVVQGRFKADAFFPDYSEFNKVIKREVKQSQGYQYVFIELTK